MTPTTELLADGRDARGRFAPGNTVALTHGARSQQVAAGLLPEQAEALAALGEKRASLERDLGGAEHLSTLTRDAVGRYLELSLIGDYLGQRLITHGPLTTKGRQRAALTAYLSVVDRLIRLGHDLGYERRPKAVTDLATRFREMATR